MHKMKSIRLLFVGLAFIFVTVYETLITSDIIVPHEVTPLKNLTEIINAGYKIALFWEPINDSNTIEAEIKFFFKQDYEKHRILYRMKDTVEYIGTESWYFEDLKNLSFLLSNVDQKYAYFDYYISASTSLYHLQYVHTLFEKLACFRVEENMASGMHYWFFHIHIRQNFISKKYGENV